MNEHYATLELHKILEMLVGECSNEASRKIAQEIEPSSDLETVRLENRRFSSVDTDFCSKMIFSVLTPLSIA